MIRTLTALALFTAVAAPAAAADIRVNIAGKDDATVEAILKDASRAVCREEARGRVSTLQFQAICESIVYTDALEQARSVSSTYSKAKPTLTASAAPLNVTRTAN